MVSYDEEDEDSDIFGESDRDDDEDDEENTAVRPHFTGYLLHQPEIQLILILLPWFRTQARHLLLRNWQPESKATPSSKRREIVLVSCCVECHPCMPMLIIFVFLPCPAWEALAYKKKSKGRKGSKPSKLQGMKFIHHRYHHYHRQWKSACCLCLALHSFVTAVDPQLKKTTMTCSSRRRWTMMTSLRLGGRAASSVEGEACLTTMTRFFFSFFFWN